MRRIFVHVSFAVCVAMAFLGTIPAANAVPSGPSITVGDVSVVEGSSGAAVIWVPVDLSVPSASLVTVLYTVTSTNADSSDFAPKTGKLTFRVGVTYQKVSVTIYGDTALEGNQDVEVTLSAPVHASISDDTGEVLIIDDDSNTTSAAVSIGNATVTEADGGVHYAYVPLTLSAPAAAAVRVEVKSACGTAPDPAPTAQTVGFARGQRSKILKYVVNADTTPENLGTAIKQIRVKAGSATVKAPEGVLTINDNDGTAPGDPPLGDSDRISVTSDGAQARFPVDTCNVPASHPSSMSGDGRFVVFGSGAINLVPGDTNNQSDLFLRDRATDTTERVGVADDGSQLSLGSSPNAWISDDGRYVAFSTSSPELVGTPPTYGAFVRDRVAGTTTRVSVLPDGSDATFAVGTGLTPDGRYAPFIANGTNLYVRDLQTATTQFVVTGLAGWFWTPMSADGQQIAFVSRSETLVPGDTNGYPDVFVANLGSGTIERVNLTPSGAQESGNTIAANNNAARVAMSRDGRYVVFWSASPNMGVAANNSAVFLRDRVAGTTERASVGIPSSLPACFSQNEGVSNDGRYVSFSVLCEHSNGVPSTSDLIGTFMRDRTAGTTTRVDALPNGMPGNLPSHDSVMSADGRYVAYSSEATNLVPDDTNHMADVFVRRIS